MSFFPEVSKIKYEGPSSTNPLAFRHYNADEKVEGLVLDRSGVVLEHFSDDIVFVPGGDEDGSPLFGRFAPCQSG